jgi:hypothetical protein
MSNTSATGGYLLPAPLFPTLPGVLSFKQFLQSVFVGISGLPGELVRPKWQKNPPKSPDIDVNWMAIGLSKKIHDFNIASLPSLGQQATGFIKFPKCNPQPSDTVTVNGLSITFVASGAMGNQVNIGTTPAITAQNLQEFLEASSDMRLTVATYSVFAQAILIAFIALGAVGNAFTLAAVSGAIFLSGPTLLNGGSNNNTTQRHQEQEIGCTFYGPQADEYVDVIADGFQIQQNLEALRLANMGFVAVGEATQVPDLINERWVDRYEMSVTLRREVQRVYPILSFASVSGSIQGDLSSGVKTVAWQSNA